MARYSAERKEAILKKLLPPQNMSVTEVAKIEGVSSKTLYHWRDELRKKGQPVLGKTAPLQSWLFEPHSLKITSSDPLCQTSKADTLLATLFSGLYVGTANTG